MQREQTAVRRLTVERLPERRVPCAFGTPEDRIHGVIGSCGAMIPFKPKHPCPSCGQRQIQAHATEPPPDGDPRILDGSVALVDATSGEVIAAQVVCARAIANRIGGHLTSMHWDAPVNARDRPANEGRLSGIVVTHRTFGFTKPSPLRRRWGCSHSMLDSTHPELFASIMDFCTTAEHVFRTQAPEVYDATATRVREQIGSAWRIADTPWTSGIINHTAALPYHVDKNNIVGSWSAMLGIRRNVNGGLLHLLDYDVWLTIPHGSITVFDGQSVAHGVTPLRLAGPNAVRFTLVAYAVAGLRACCADPAGEAKRAALRATEAASATRESHR